MDINGIMDIWNTQMSKADGKNHTENTVLYILSQAMNEWKAYKEIGTVEEFRRLKAMKFTEDTISADEAVYVEDIDNLLKEMG